jgi:predicted Mrr-cat superfamily restriction endonuclease
VYNNKETEGVQNKRKIKVTLQQIQQDSFSSPLSTPFSSATITTSISDIDQKNSISKPKYNLLKDFKIRSEYRNK